MMIEPMPRPCRRLAIAAILVPAAFAQTPAPSPLKIGDVTAHGSFRTRAEMWNWFGDSEGGDYAYSGNLFRVAFSRERRAFDWTFEIAAPFLLGLPDDAGAPAPQGALGLGANYFSANDNHRNAVMAFPKQAFVRFRNLGGDKRQSLRLGRFEFLDGAETTPANATLAALKRDRIAQRLIGNFGWSHVGRSFDGAHYSLNARKFNFTAMGALATRGVFQVDGWGNLNVAIGYAALSGGFTHKRQAGDWRLFGIYYDDWRGVLKTDNRALAVRRADPEPVRIGTFGGHYLHARATRAGSFDFLAWGAAQTGAWGRQDHRAAAGAAEAGWQPVALRRLRPWLRAGYFRSTGDSDPNDGRHGTFFQLLPTPRPYARFPFFNLVNNRDAFASAILRPHARVTVRSDVRWLALSDSADLWYAGGGAFQPWSFGYTGRPGSGRTGLATLYDASVDWNIGPSYAITGYAAWADAGVVIESIYPRKKNGAMGYLEFTYRF
jgi:hypothetical protein